MASVWSAVHETLGRPVAVKFIHARGRSAEVATARFMQEARIAAAVQHRFVVDIFDFGRSEEGEPYMVMELLQGESLADRITRGPPVPVRHFVRMMTQALSGLDAVHKAGIVHRDLKPENIYIIHDADGGFPKLLDFGISRVDDSIAGEKATRLTKEGTLLGTPWYMSPEQVRGREVDGRTDLYSIGVIMYETLTGVLPFDAEAVGDLLVQIATSQEVPMAQRRPDLPPVLSEVIARALSKEPEERFDSALSMRLALQALEKELPDAFTVVIERADSEPPVALGSEELLPTGGMGDGDSIAPASSGRSSMPTMDEEEPGDASRSAHGALATEDNPFARRSKMPWLALAAALLLAGVGAVAFGMGGSAAEEPAPPLETAEASVAEPPEVVPTPAVAPGVIAEEGEAGEEPHASADAGTEGEGGHVAASEETEREASKASRRRQRARALRQRAAQRRRSMSMMEAAASSPESFRDPGF